MHQSNDDFGQGAITSFSQKQKINAKSSTEAGLTSADEAMLQILWTHYFLEAQGYAMDENFLEDNQSAIIMATNGKNANSK